MYLLVKTESEFRQALDLIRTEPDYIVLDTETNTLNVYRDENPMIGISIYLPVAEMGYYFSFRHQYKAGVEGWENVGKDKHNLPIEWVSRLSDAINHGDRTLITFNGKFDLHVMHVEGMDIPEKFEDVMLAAQLLNENEPLTNPTGRRGAFALKRLARQYLGPDSTPGEDELFEALAEMGYRGKESAKGEMWRLSAEQTAQYAIDDVALTWKLRGFYLPALERWRQWDLYLEYNEFYRFVLFRMERNGVRLDVGRLAELDEEAQVEASEIHCRLIQLADGATWLSDDVDDLELAAILNSKDHSPEIVARRKALFNPNSPRQVSFLLEKFGTFVFSTAKDVLQELADKGSEVARLLLDYRIQSKASSTFYRPWMESADSDGYLHPTFLILTSTGRTVCFDPNLLQVPRKGRYKVKDAVIPEDGMKLFQGDYASQELYFAIFASGEQRMKELVNQDADLHWNTTEGMDIRGLLYGDASDRDILISMGVSLAGLTDEQMSELVNKGLRHIGKSANFGLLYGMGARRGSEYFAVSETDARKLIEGWHNLYPAFKRAYYGYQDIAKQWRTPDGAPGGKFQYVRLEDGRVRHYSNYIAAGEQPPYHTAFNFVVQGSCATITRRATIAVCKAFPDDSVFRPWATVYDSLIGDIAEDRLADVVPEIQRIMTQYPMDPQLKVDPEVGDTWYRLEPWNGQ